MSEGDVSVTIRPARWAHARRALLWGLFSFGWGWISATYDGAEKWWVPPVMAVASALAMVATIVYAFATLRNWPDDVIEKRMQKAYAWAIGLPLGLWAILWFLESVWGSIGRLEAFAIIIFCTLLWIAHKLEKLQRQIALLERQIVRNDFGNEL